MLQATNLVQLRGDNAGRPGPRLLPVEQCPESPLLRVRFVQSGRFRKCEKWLAQALCPQHCHASPAHWRLLHWLLCFPEYQKGRNRLPIWCKSDVQGPSQMGLLLVSENYSTCRRDSYSYQIPIFFGYSPMHVQHFLNISIFWNYFVLILRSINYFSDTLDHLSELKHI